MALSSQSSKKIIVRVDGGIGNQLFIYAAGRRLALVNAAELVLDDVNGFLRDNIYKRTYQLDHFHVPCRKAGSAERLEPFPRIRARLLKSINRYVPFEKRTYIYQEGLDFDPRILGLQVRSILYLQGYWQSERYFKDVENIIREDMRVKPPIDKQNKNMAQEIASHLAVAVHIRFFDEHKENGCNNLKNDYYIRAIERMERMLNRAHYYIFSDNPSAARSLDRLSPDRTTVVCHNLGDEFAYADLWLMSLCRHFIIANSTFSWWGAWLSSSRDKIVIAPGIKKFGGKCAWGFDGLIPEGWLTI